MKQSERPDLTDETKTDANGASFYSEALAGSGTINAETGEYGPPKPDPTVLRGVDANTTSGGRKVDTTEEKPPATETKPAGTTKRSGTSR